MEEKPLITIKTKVEKNDYRKFFYVDFLSKKIIQIALGIFLTVFLLMLFSLGGLVLLGIYKYTGNLMYYIALYIFLIVLIAVIHEYKINKYYKTDKTELFTSYQIIKFYEDFIIVSFEKEEGGRKRSYNGFYRIFESKDLILLYQNAYSSGIIRKKDVDRETLVELINLLKRKFGQNYKTSKRL